MLEKHFPLYETITTYRKDYFKNDIVAALTVAVVALPQSMAYAIIAGVDPVYGLYAAMVLAILGSAFGNSNHLATGPTNAISLLIAGTMGMYVGQQNFFSMLFLLTFMVGAIQFIMGVLRLGKLVNYVSHSVIVGFTAGAGVIIALGQFNQLLGISLPKGHFSTVEKVAYTVEHFAQTNHVALGLGVGTILVTVLLKKINKNLPGALLGLVFCAVAVMVFNLGQFDIKLTGNIPSAIPPFQMLSFDPGMMSSLAGGAAVIAIIGLVEAVSISKSIAAQTQQKLDSNQEFIGQGVANMGGAFLGSIAGSGSFTRSAIAFQNGGRTRLAGVLTGVVVLVILLFLAPYAKYIPNAALAGVIMVVAYSMIDKKAVRKVLTSNRNDAAVLVVTFLTTILAPDLEYAIYAGVVISIALYLKDTGVAGVRMLEGTVPERLKEAPGEAATGAGVTTIDLGGDLYFGSSMDFEEKLEKALAMGSRAVVVNMAGVSTIDITALEILENFVKRASREGKKVIISGVRPAICKCLEKAHITGLVGKESLFMCEREVFGALSKALSAAEVYLKQAPAAAMQTVAEAVEELRPATAAAGRNPLAKLKDIMEGLLEEPFLRAEIHAMDVILKKV